MPATVLQISVSRGGVPKKALTEAHATRDGVDGDRHANPQVHGGPMQAVLLITHEGTEELIAQGFPLFDGALGENITTIGLDRREVRVGQHWAIGDELIVEITKLRAPCKTLNVYNTVPGKSIQAAVYDSLAKTGDPASPVWGLGGFYASVVQPGLVRSGDAVRLAAATEGSFSIDE